MKESKLPQIIVLVLLVALCLGYVVYRLSGSNTQAACPPQENPVEQVAPSMEPAPDPEASQNLDQTVPAEQTALNAVVMAAKKDPFAPEFVSAVQKPMKVAAAAPPRLGMTLPPFTPQMPMHVTALESSGEVQEATSTQTYRLTGVIRGETNIAIIRSGDSGRHIVKEGQYINGRYKVIAIREASVIVAFGNERKEIKLGGETNAS